MELMISTGFCTKKNFPLEAKQDARSFLFLKRLQEILTIIRRSSSSGASFGIREGLLELLEAFEYTTTDSLTGDTSNVDV